MTAEVYIITALRNAAAGGSVTNLGRGGWLKDLGSGRLSNASRQVHLKVIEDFDSLNLDVPAYILEPGA